MRCTWICEINLLLRNRTFVSQIPFNNEEKSLDLSSCCLIEYSFEFTKIMTSAFKARLYTTETF